MQQLLQPTQNGSCQTAQPVWFVKESDTNTSTLHHSSMCNLADLPKHMRKKHNRAQESTTQNTCSSRMHAPAAGVQLICVLMKPMCGKLPRRQDNALALISDQGHSEDRYTAWSVCFQIKHRVSDENARSQRKLCV